MGSYEKYKYCTFDAFLAGFCAELIVCLLQNPPKKMHESWKGIKMRYKNTETHMIMQPYWCEPRLIQAGACVNKA